MTEKTNDSQGQDGLDQKSKVDQFVEMLSEQDKMLVLLQAELYDNSWQAMLDDLKNRLEGKPYIFKLANRIQDDIARIEKLLTFEKDNQVKLSDFVKPPTSQ